MNRPASACPEPDLANRIECWIEQRTGGRVHRLRVQSDINGLIVICGHTGSYYVRQLALAAVLEMFEAYGERDMPSFKMDIVVGRGNPAAQPSVSDQAGAPTV